MEGWKDRLENTGESLLWLRRNCYQQTLFIWWPKPYDEISCSKLGLVCAVKASQMAQTAVYRSVPHERRQRWLQVITTQVMCRALSFQVVRAETLNLTTSTQFFFVLVHYIGHPYNFCRELVLHGRSGKHFEIYVVKPSGIFPPKHLEASGEVHTIPCKKVMPYGRKPFIWLHCCGEWKLTGQCYLQGSRRWVKSCLPYLCKYFHASQ